MRKLTVFIGISGFLALSLGAAEVTMDLEPNNDPPGKIVVKGMAPESLRSLLKSGPSENDLAKLLQVYTVVGGKPAAVPMSGEVTIEQDKIVFTPRYPLRAGMTYHAVFDPSGLKRTGSMKLEKDFSLPAMSPTEATRLVEIFPSSDLLPENLLRLYLHFSAPMSRGEAYRRVHLQDDKGNTIETPFLELGEELWSPDGKRFTLYFDPGRIKRGLQPRELFGPALLEGGAYSLTIDAAWLDATGRPLKESFTKKFRVGPPDDKQPNPKDWRIRAPRMASREPVMVDLDEPLDSGMLQRVLDIRDAGGNLVAGDIRLSNNERRWEYAPTKAWSAGAYRLIVSTGLEDLAGNSIRRLFEIDILRPAVPGIESEVVELPFHVKP